MPRRPDRTLHHQNTIGIRAPPASQGFEKSRPSPLIRSPALPKFEDWTNGRALAREKDGPPIPPLILIADDDPDWRVALRTLLEHEGYEVDEAKNGAVAVQKARERRPDLVILDLSMPVLDGCEAARRLRQEGGPPLLAVSGSDRAIARDRKVQALFDGFLRKPAVTPVLLERIARLLRRDVAGGELGGFRTPEAPGRGEEGSDERGPEGSDRDVDEGPEATGQGPPTLAAGGAAERRAALDRPAESKGGDRSPSDRP